MPIVVENKPVVHRDPIIDEAATLLTTIKVGQSFVIPAQYAAAVRNRIKLVDGKRFRTASEGAGLRVGRIA